MTPQAALESMPKEIKVGPHTYTIILVDSIVDSDVPDGTARGSIEPETQVIEILSSTSSASQVVGVLIHELLHAIWDDRDLGKQVKEEKMVLQYESGLVQLFQDNPKLLTWIKRGLK